MRVPRSDVVISPTDPNKRQTPWAADEYTMLYKS